MKKWFGNLKISYKLTLSFLLITLMVFGIGIIGIVNLANLAEHEKYLYENSTAMGSSESTTADSTSSATITADKLVNDSAKSTVTIYIMSAIVVVAIVVSILFGRYISRLIGNPMKLFAEYGKLLAVGDVAIDRVTTPKDQLLKSREDEIGILANSFDRVIESTYRQTEVTRRIAEGDLTTVVTIRSENDIAGKALSDLVDKYHELTANILAAADQVSSGASLVSSSSAVLSRGAAEQKEYVTELTSSLDAVAGEITSNAMNAKKTDQHAQSAKNNAETGNKQMQEMLAAMAEINVASGSIGKIIKVIDDIAFQTNILALNAAVEAARAGQHGKGFAVVAEEVRTLAARSARAAKETTELIDVSRRKVEAGMRIAHDTAVALEQIVDEVNSAAGLVATIAHASDTQGAAIKKINQSISEMSQIAYSNATSAEESALASEELSGQAERLEAMIATFKVNASNQRQFGALASDTSVESSAYYLAESADIAEWRVNGHLPCSASHTI